MKCNEIQERFVELLYDEEGTPSAGPELLAHIRSCSSCQKELAELKDLRGTLKVWRDEPPLRPVTIPQPSPSDSQVRFPVWNLFRYAAASALLVLAFFAVFNAQIKWDKDGFSFRTGLFSQAQPSADAYTKQEMNVILERVLDISQERNRQMMLHMMDTQDDIRADEIRAIAQQIKESKTRN